MRYYFLRGGRIAGVEMLPLGLSDHDAVARAHTLSSKGKGGIRWLRGLDGARFIFRVPRRLTRLRPASRAATRRPINNSTRREAVPADFSHISPINNGCEPQVVMANG